MKKHDPRFKALRDAVAEQRARLERVLDEIELPAVMLAFEVEAARIVQWFIRLFKRAGKAVLEPMHVYVAQQQLARRVIEAVANVVREVVAGTRATVGAAVAGVGDFLGKMTGKEVLSPERVAALVERHSFHVGNLRARTAAALAPEIDQAVRARFLALQPGKDRVADLVTSVGEVVDSKAWQVERLVRTEASFAYNGAQDEAIVESSAVVPGLWKRWTELVDESGEPFDLAVGVDSIVMHGQVARPGGSFVLPPDARLVSKRGKQNRLVGRRWQHPPNRPNDRAVLLPWLPDWPLGGWQWDGMRRVPLN